MLALGSLRILTRKHGCQRHEQNTSEEKGKTGGEGRQFPVPKNLDFNPDGDSTAKVALSYRTSDTFTFLFNKINISCMYVCLSFYVCITCIPETAEITNALESLEHQLRPW